MLLLKDAPWYACLRAKCTSKLGALLGLWPGQSFNLNPATTSRLWCNATLGTEKNSHDASVGGNSWTSALRKLKAHECRASKIDHIKYQPNSAPCCPVLVPRNDSVVPAGIPESMPGGDLPKRCHSETLQENGPQGNLVREPFWYHCKPLEFVRSETNLTTTPLEPLWRARICRSYWQDTVGTWRCPVAVAVTWNDLATLWYFIRLNSAQIGQVDCFFFAPGCIGPITSSVLRIFVRILFRSWDIFTGNPEDLQFPHPIWDLLSPGANFQYPRKISTDVALIAPWAHPLAARRRASVRLELRTNLWTWPLFVSPTTRNPTKNELDSTTPPKSGDSASNSCNTFW